MLVDLCSIMRFNLFLNLYPQLAKSSLFSYVHIESYISSFVFHFVFSSLSNMFVLASGVEKLSILLRAKHEILHKSIIYIVSGFISLIALFIIYISKLGLNVRAFYSVSMLLFFFIILKIPISKISLFSYISCIWGFLTQYMNF